MRCVLASVLCSVLASPVAATIAPDIRGGGPRLRPQDTRLTHLLQNGIARSATLRELAARIEASDVIVYIALDPLMKSSLAGKLTWMTRAGDYRYVRVSISTELNADLMIATLAHELQHAVEVTEDPNVTDQRSLTALYQRIGHPSRAALPSAWETLAAQETGHRVRRELGETPTVVASRAAETGQL